MNNRVEWLDIAKGLGIFCIVIGHNAVPQWLNDWVYSFHVPMFFIISGYFYRPRGWRETLAKGWKQLLRPMLLTILIAQALMLFLYVRHGFWSGPPVGEWLIGVLTNRGFGHVFALWFLAALFWGKLWMCLMERFPLPSMAQFYFSVALFFAGYVLFHLYVAPWVFFRGMVVPFYLLVGSSLRRSSILEQRSLWNLVVAISVVCMAWLSPVNLHRQIFPYGMVSVLTTVVISVSVLYVVKWLADVSHWPKKIFLYAGQNSLIILCLHSLVHTLQLDVLFGRSLPPIGNAHFVLGMCFVALAEFFLLVLVVSFLQKIPVVHRFFHGK